MKQAAMPSGLEGGEDGMNFDIYIEANRPV
jgi:hypothetical protein